jgi:cell division protein FtsL
MESAVIPSVSLKENILGSLPAKNVPQQTKITGMKNTAERRSSFNRLAMAASWVLVILLVGLSAYLYNSNANLNKDIAALDQKVSGAQNKVDELNTKLASLDTYRRLKNDATMTAVKLASTKPGIEQQAEVFWNKHTGDLYIDFSALPQTAAGKQYQLWFIRDGKPIDAGVINLSDAAIIQKMKNCPGAQTFAITIEKEGGSPAPTLDQMVVAGNVTD